MSEDPESKMIRAGSKTYFFDIKKTKEKDPFLVITESRFKGEGEERERASITIFQEHISEFIDTLQEIAEKVG